jgi:hypothetical protein
MSLPPIEQGITPEENRPTRLASGVCRLPIRDSGVRPELCPDG